MPEPLVVVGAGGFGRCTLDVVDAINAVRPVFDLIGVIDDGPSDPDLGRLARRGVRYLGPTESWIERGRLVRYAIGVGSPVARRRLADQLDGAGMEAVTVVDPRAVVGSGVTLGEGSVVLPGVVVGPDAVIGRHVHLSSGVAIGHDARIEEFVSVNPNAAVSGSCTVGAGALIGAGSVVLQGREIGAGATVGAGACVTRDVPSGHIARGEPSRSYLKEVP